MADDSQQWEAPTFYTCNGVDERCSIEATVYGDYFNLGACIFFVAAHALLLAAQAFLCWRGRKEQRVAWSFVSFLAAGTAFEIMGYCARVAMTQDPWSYGAFVIQLLMLILGPTLAAASISVTFKHLVLWYGPTWSVLRPSLYPWVFVGTDFASIVIQAAGTIIASIATEGEEFNQGLLDVGRGLLVAGVVFQAANMIFCGGLMLVYFFRRSKALRVEVSTVTGRVDETSKRPCGKTQEKRVGIFIAAIIVAYVAIITRCIYRIPEMQSGWASELMRNETLFLVFDGAMILIAVAVLTCFHPHIFFPFLGERKTDGSNPDREENVEGQEVRIESKTSL